MGDDGASTYYYVESDNISTFREDTSRRYATSNLVDATSSQVLVPSDVYHSSSATKRDIYWTRSLNSIFTENADNFDKVGYQYFISTNGATRLFPATGKMSCQFTWFKHVPVVRMSSNDDFRFHEPSDLRLEIPAVLHPISDSSQNGSDCPGRQWKCQR